MGVAERSLALWVVTGHVCSRKLRGKDVVEGDREREREKERCENKKKAARRVFIAGNEVRIIFRN